MDDLDLLLDSPRDRIAVIGNAGSGKTSLARALAARLGAARLDLDDVYWERGRIAVRRDHGAAQAELAQFCDAHERWIVEGCYGDLVGSLLVREPLLVWLDPGVAACLRHCRARPFEPSKFASAAEQDAHLAALLAWIEAYETRGGELSRAGHRALFEGYLGPKLHLLEEPALTRDVAWERP